MKGLLLCFLTCFYGIKTYAQIKENTRVLTTTLSNISIGISNFKSTSNNNPTQSGTSSGYGFATEVMYGRIKMHKLLSYGVNFSWRLNTQSNGGSDNRTVAFGPVFSYQKFYAIKADRLYFSPFFKFSAGFQFANQHASASSSALMEKGYLASFIVNPFSLTFLKDNKTNFLFSLGAVTLSYDRTKSFFAGNLNESQIISKNLTLYGSIGGINFGLQKLF